MVEDITKERIEQLASSWGFQCVRGLWFSPSGSRESSWHGGVPNFPKDVGALLRYFPLPKKGSRKATIKFKLGYPSGSKVQCRIWQGGRVVAEAEATRSSSGWDEACATAFFLSAELLLVK